MNPSRQQKACPVVTRFENGRVEILSFRHPQEKLQVVKGTIDPGEVPADAAVRELSEESGLVANPNPELLVVSDDLLDGNTWHFFLCDVTQPIPNSWDFLTTDDGGHTFSFFWYPVDRPLDDQWHPLFHSVFDTIRPILIARVTSQ